MGEAMKYVCSYCGASTGGPTCGMCGRPLDVRRWQYLAAEHASECDVWAWCLRSHGTRARAAGAYLEGCRSVLEYWLPDGVRGVG